VWKLLCAADRAWSALESVLDAINSYQMLAQRVSLTLLFRLAWEGASEGKERERLQAARINNWRARAKKNT
jgi:hypothetical protein